ncbi:dynamin family protein [Pantoea phytobeneficialis]|uniref:DGTPase n=1 Tax=Pantoea phytobeneficialis TaxID=2052056 RepID=A0AAP9KSA0_9GAMM|nr:dynamin family protein [Pantoea phytobeneficialis]MDO6406991.1 dynamin family protein [Pantoea phytobeneficialis]QGR09956.1 dGTPase [Pantoea phytobeneficialis]
MHETTIALLCDEASRLLQLNIDLLHKMTDEPQMLPETKQGDLEQLFDRQQAAKKREELAGEQQKIAQREMVLAIVGTMKAGKSTTINAIVGKEILPNRNTPMTSVPTLIRHVPGKITPDLTVRNTEVLRSLLAELKEKTAGDKARKGLFGLMKDDEKSRLLNVIRDQHWLQDNYQGEEAIFSFLNHLNDLVRLSGELNVTFPFDAFNEFHELPLIEVEFSHLTGMDDSQGTLTLLDTPGPNEAGQPHIQAMMREQLQKASAVLAVLDYTQLNSLADQEVRNELNAFTATAAGRLFVLVNKFDQQDRHSDDEATVKRRVPLMFDDHVVSAERVYPGSARHAYLANRARSTLNRGGSLSASEEWVADFAQLAYGRRWKEKLADRAQTLSLAEDIWQESLLEQLITEVVQAAHNKAAALAVDSAVARLVQNAQEVSAYLAVRHQGLNADVEALQQQIDALLTDSAAITSHQQVIAEEVTASQHRIEQQTVELLDDVQQQLADEIACYFREGKLRDERDPRQQRTASPTESFMHFFAQGHADGRDFDPRQPMVKFSSRKQAEDFITNVENAMKTLLTPIEEEVKTRLNAIVSGIEQSFQGNAMSAVAGIAQQINTRLGEEGFSMTIAFPEVAHLQANLAVQTRIAHLLEAKKFRESRRRRADGVWGTVCGWFDSSDWGWEEFSVDVVQAEVDVRKIREEITTHTDQYFAELESHIEAQIINPIINEINQFFEQFRSKVEQLRNTLIQSTEDQRADQQQRLQLTRCLQELQQLTPELMRDAKALKDELGMVF